MMIDDADIVDSGTCQLETWVDLHRNSTEYWAMPACNIADKWELSIGGAWQDNHSQANGRAFEAQAKIPVLNGWSEQVNFALALAYEYQHEESEGENTWVLNVPMSIPLGSENITWHNNLGTTFEQSDKNWQLTWGTGVEYDYTNSLSFYAEVFSESDERPWFQLATGY